MLNWRGWDVEGAESRGVRLRPNERVRVHQVGDRPTVEGILVSRSHRELAIRVPVYLVAPGANPAEPDAREVRVLNEHVACYEVL